MTAPVAAEPTSILKWMAARAANHRAAAASFWGEVAWLNEHPGEPDRAHRIDVARFHALRHEREARAYEDGWSAREQEAEQLLAEAAQALESCRSAVADGVLPVAGA